ncbi:MAG: hypothetical protein ACP5UV_02070 [Thermoplasmata archaeon]
MFGQASAIDYASSTWTVFTNPQIAGVGMTENDLSKMHGSCSYKTFQLTGLTKASITGETEGLVKITVNPDDGRIVGMQIVSPNATDIITEGA